MTHSVTGMCPTANDGTLLLHPGPQTQHGHTEHALILHLPKPYRGNCQLLCLFYYRASFFDPPGSHSLPHGYHSTPSWVHTTLPLTTATLNGNVGGCVTYYTMSIWSSTSGKAMQRVQQRRSEHLVHSVLFIQRDCRPVSSIETSKQLAYRS